MSTSTSYFAKARDLTFGNVHIQHHDHHYAPSTSKPAFELLRDNVAVGALNNSSERCDAPKCHPETRLAIQDEIMSWLDESQRTSDKRKILWMSGPAGAGKTAIAGSVADRCQEKGVLAASFFFSSSTPVTNKRTKMLLIPTLAYQLFQRDGLQDLREPILEAIEQDPTVFELQLKDQLEALILKPLRAIRKGGGEDMAPRVVIIDGIDECEAPCPPAKRYQPEHLKACEADQLEVLSALHQASLDPDFPFTLFIISRPERVISTFFNGPARSQAQELFLDEKYDPDGDIALFLRAKFSELCNRYQIPPQWPSDASITLLVKRSSGQFIYAATVIRYLQDGPDTPQQQLRRLFLATRFNTIIAAEYCGDIDWPVDFEGLDALYAHILSCSPNPRRSVAWIQCLEMLIDWQDAQLRPYPAVFVRQFLESEPGEAEHLFGNLRSLISIPAAGDQISPYKVWHKSLLDFLTGPQPRIKGPLDSSDSLVDDEDMCGCRGPADIDGEQTLLEIVERAGQPVSVGQRWKLLPRWEGQAHEVETNSRGEDAYVVWYQAYYRSLEANRPYAYPELDADTVALFWNRFQRLTPVCISLPIQASRKFSVSRHKISPIVAAFHQSESLDVTRTLAEDYYVFAHKFCHWSGTSCTPECKAWRKTLMTVYKRHGWRTPGLWYRLHEARIKRRYIVGHMEKLLRIVKFLPPKSLDNGSSSVRSRTQSPKS